MAFNKYKNGAWQEPEDGVRKYENGAWTDCEFAKSYKSGAWEEVWSAETVLQYYLRNGAYENEAYENLSDMVASSTNVKTFTATAYGASATIYFPALGNFAEKTLRIKGNFPVGIGVKMSKRYSGGMSSTWLSNYDDASNELTWDIPSDTSTSKASYINIYATSDSTIDISTLIATIEKIYVAEPK